MTRHRDGVAESLLGEVLITRQPILDRNLTVVAYELLHHDLLLDSDDSAGRDVRATAAVLIEGVLGWREHLIADEDAHVNVPIDAFESGELLDLPADRLVLELPRRGEEVAPSRRSLRQHRGAGFRVLLDAVVPDDPRLALIDEVDLVKVDLVASGTAPGLRLVRGLAARGVTVVAGRVESPALFDRAVAVGAALVQGFFFTQPRTVRTVRPVGLSPTHLSLLQACSAELFDLDQVETLIRQDVTLADRFLRLLTSPGLRWREADSVRDGLLMLGDRAVRRWVRLLVLSAAVRDGHPELATLAAVRARHCEALQEAIGSSRQLDAFSLGMFSVLGHDGVVAPEVLAELPVSDDVAAALSGGRGGLRTVLDIALFAERADWNGVVSRGVSLGLTPADIARIQVDALAWARHLGAVVGHSRPSPIDSVS